MLLCRGAMIHGLMHLQERAGASGKPAGCQCKQQPTTKDGWRFDVVRFVCKRNPSAHAWSGRGHSFVATVEEAPGVGGGVVPGLKAMS